jgi:hypothetical protein
MANACVRFSTQNTGRSLSEARGKGKIEAAIKIGRAELQGRSKGGQRWKRGTDGRIDRGTLSGENRGQMTLSRFTQTKSRSLHQVVSFACVPVSCRRTWQQSWSACMRHNICASTNIPLASDPFIRMQNSDICFFTTTITAPRLG